MEGTCSYLRLDPFIRGPSMYSEMYGMDHVVEDDRIGMDMSQRFSSILYSNERLQGLQQFNQADLLDANAVSVIQHEALSCATVEPDGCVTYRLDGWAPSPNFQNLQVQLYIDGPWPAKLIRTLADDSIVGS